MDKKVYLFDYKDIQHEYTIKNFEKVKSMFINMLSGDWVLYVIYENDYEIFDTGEYNGYRNQDFYEGTYIINPNRIDELNRLQVSDDLEDML